MWMDCASSSCWCLVCEENAKHFLGHGGAGESMLNFNGAL